MLILLLQLLKPAFTILRDRSSKCFLLLIRGTHSMKDTLTAANGSVVPFHHSVLHDGGISNLILGYAHCGMVAAARWIAKLSTPFLLKALVEHPDYKVQVEIFSFLQSNLDCTIFFTPFFPTITTYASCCCFLYNEIGNILFLRNDMIIHIGKRAVFQYLTLSLFSTINFCNAC